MSEVPSCRSSLTSLPRDIRILVAVGGSGSWFHVQPIRRPVGMGDVVANRNVSLRPVLQSLDCYLFLIQLHYMHAHCEEGLSYWPGCHVREQDVDQWSLPTEIFSGPASRLCIRVRMPDMSSEKIVMYPPMTRWS